jgi:hypothetical protein
MAVNIKFEHDDAVAVCSNILSKPAEKRHGITGFWAAKLSHVQNEQVIRLADMTHHRFLLEAVIDPEDTHSMDAKRREEYIDHELVKKRIRLDKLSPDERRMARDRVWKENLQPCINRKRSDGTQLPPRIVIAFRNAHAISGEIKNFNKNAVWYTKD